MLGRPWLYCCPQNFNVISRKLEMQSAPKGCKMFPMNYYSGTLIFNNPDLKLATVDMATQMASAAIPPREACRGMAMQAGVIKVLHGFHSPCLQTSTSRWLVVLHFFCFTLWPNIKVNGYPPILATGNR